MEIEELRNSWKKEDKRITKSVKINKEISCKKLRLLFNRVKVKKIIFLILPYIYVPIIFAFVIFPHIKNDGSIWFYLSFTFFLMSIIISYAVNLYYFFRLKKIDYTKSVLQIQKEILHMEISEKKWHIISYLLVPFILLAALRMFGRITSLNPTTIIFILLAIVFFVIGSFIKIKIILPKEYYKIKSYLNKIEELENDLKWVE